MILVTECIHCRRPAEIEVSRAEYKAWMLGTPTQTAFPTMSADDRELLISGTCGTCFDQMFGEFE